MTHVKICYYQVKINGQFLEIKYIFQLPLTAEQAVQKSTFV